MTASTSTSKFEQVTGLIQNNFRMLLNAATLVGTMVLNAVMGFAFWWVAAQYYDQAAIGIATAASSAMLVLAEIGVLGLTTYMVGAVPKRPKEVASLVFTGMIISFVSAGIVGLVFAGILPLFSEDLNVLNAGWVNIALFMLGVSLTSSGLVVDHAMVGLNKGEYQLWRNLFFSFVRLLAVAFVALMLDRRTPLDIFGAWVVAAAISLAIVPLIAFARGLRWQALKFDRSIVKSLGGEVLAHHVLNLSFLGPAMAIPTLAVILISAEAAALFYLAWMFTTMILVVPYALSTSLYGAASESPESLVQRMRVSIAVSTLSGIVANIVLYIVGEPIMALFGAEYIDAVPLLRILALTAFPAILGVMYSAVVRIYDEMVKGAIIMVFGAALNIGGIIIGAQVGGAIGMAWGYVISTAIVALITSPMVLSVALARREPPADFDADNMISV
ncbi:MAG: hypothetical protein AAF846_01480 [Chloroflexota bacterium]